MYEIISQYLEYLEIEKGLAQNTIDAYKDVLYAQSHRKGRPFCTFRTECTFPD